MTEQSKIYRLVMVQGPEEGRRYVVRHPSALLGRDPKCRVRVDADGVADQQLAIRIVDSDAVLTVLDHADPVYIGGEPVVERRLQPGDVIEMGGVRLEFQWVEPLPFYENRRRSWVERGAAAAVAVVLAIQVLVLAVLGLIRVGEPSGDEALAGEGRLPGGPEDRQDMVRISRDVVQLRGWALDIGARVEDMFAELGDEAVPVGEAERPAAELASDGESLRLLAQARERIVEGDWMRAEALLDRAQRADPALAGVYMARARLYERQGDFPGASVQWDLAVTHAAAGAEGEEAQAERDRVARVIRQRDADRLLREEARARSEVDARERAAAEARVRTGVNDAARTERDGESAAAETVEAASARRIRIDNVRRERFQNRENYEEIRLVRFDLAPRKSVGEVRTEDVGVQVHFFDRDLDNGDISLSRAPSPDNGLVLKETWPPEQVQSLSALYMVPRDFRRTESRTLGVRRQYYGFVIRVYYQGQLQDEQAFPSSLHDLALELL